MGGLTRRRVAALLLLAGSAGLAPRRGRAALARITIAANPAGTNFNVIGGGFAKLLQETLGIPSIVRPYAGSSVYLPLLQRGEVTLGINSSIDSFVAFTGEPPYRSRLTNLRALMAVYPLAYMYWCRESSGMRRVEDLKGKRVVLDYRSLVVLGRLNRAILATGGLTESDIEPVTVAGLVEGARAVLEGRADAVAMGYQLPIVRQTHVGISGGLRFLTMGSDEAKLAQVMPGAGVITLSPDQLSVGIDAPIRTAVYDTYLASGTHLTADDAYAIVRTLHTHWPELQHSYALLAGVRASDAAPAAAPMPYHAGAIRFFQEIGLWSLAHEENQKRLLGSLTA
jgi:TRAP transporter TAXI family solute receptor